MLSVVRYVERKINKELYFGFKHQVTGWTNLLIALQSLPPNPSDTRHSWVTILDSSVCYHGAFGSLFHLSETYSKNSHSLEERLITWTCAQQARSVFLILKDII